MSKTPSEIYAGAVADLCWRLPQATRSSPEALQAVFEQNYAQHKERHARAASEEDRMGMAVFAAGLFALGRLDVAGDVLAMPETRGQVGHVRRVVHAMLPDAAEAVDDADLLHFIEGHRDALRFDPVAGVYRLDRTAR